MAHIFLDTSEQGMVVFKIWKSLAYKTRLLISIVFILSGLILQYISFNILPGIILVFMGNLFLLPSGYTNKINLGRFDPHSDWEKVEHNKIDELLAFDRKVRKWDFSSIDISNGFGGLIFIFLLVVLVITTIYAFEEGRKTLQILSLDTAVLILPYWVTGLRFKFTVPKLTLKVKLIETLLSTMETELKPHKVEFFFLFKGKDTKIPVDVKFKVNISDHHKDFLGYYGQITLNSVQSAVYPYFYVVMVARRGFGLQEVHRTTRAPKKLVKEFKQQKDVEVLVLRQNTKLGNKGYTTNKKQVHYIFSEGLQLAEKVAVK